MGKKNYMRICSNRWVKYFCMHILLDGGKCSNQTLKCIYDGQKLFN